MARDHARIQLAVWADPEWRQLDLAAQHAYWTLLTQPRLSYCGLLDYFPSRLASLTNGVTESKVKAAVRTLERQRFVVVDRATHELLIRTYVRHDGVLDRVNMGKAAARAVDNIVSATIREAVTTELARILKARPGLAGWAGFAEISPKAMAMTSAMASAMPLPIASEDVA